MAYLGGVELVGQRVLEIGTASGHLCFTMERLGAEVVAFDLSQEFDWDMIPFSGSGYNLEESRSQRKEHLERLNNGFWYAHQAFESLSQVVYGSVYDIPTGLGQFDICTLGAVLLHLRDPLRAIEEASKFAKECIVITDGPVSADDRDLSRRNLQFLPDAESCYPTETWWKISPGLIAEFLKVLGFVHTEVTFHHQRFEGAAVELFTVVGRKS